MKSNKNIRLRVINGGIIFIERSHNPLINLFKQLGNSCNMGIPTEDGIYILYINEIAVHRPFVEDFLLDNKLIYNDISLFCILNERPKYRKILSFQICVC